MFVALIKFQGHSNIGNNETQSCVYLYSSYSTVFKLCFVSEHDPGIYSREAILPFFQRPVAKKNRVIAVDTGIYMKSLERCVVIFFIELCTVMPVWWLAHLAGGPENVRVSC